MVGRLDVAAPEAMTAKRKAGLYDLIVIDGAVEQVPDALVKALADGGRLVTGLVERGITRLALGRKAAGAVALLALAEIGMPVLAEGALAEKWAF